jgi:hypothetical protein
MARSLFTKRRAESFCRYSKQKNEGGEFDSPPSSLSLRRGTKLQPIGVLALLAPEPEVSTRITPD